ncbi:MAG TPA: FG-GAP-like repeat-containing protein, partial [Chryseolinea sp.]|nr:FG-GAP-like repeat-containing protein [Chryseolinea sp.]
GSKLTILKNTSTGTGISFAPETHEQRAENVLSFALVDIDQDNDLDIHYKAYSYDWSNSQSVDLVFINKSTTPGPVPAVPANLGSAIGPNVALSWTNVPGILYNIELKKNGVAYKASATSATGKLLLPTGSYLRTNGSLNVRDLQAGTYQWRLQAVSPSGLSSAFTAVNNFTVGESPATLTAQPSDLLKVRLCWTYGGPGNPTFAVFRKTSPGASAEIGRTTAGVLCFDDNNVPANASLEYYVKAVNGASYSAPSNTVAHHSTMFVESQFGDSDPQHIISARALPADYDMDGDYDLEFIGRIGLGSQNNNVLLRNNGSGVFTTSGSMLTAESFKSPYFDMTGARDVDNDGDPDLVLMTGSEYSWQKVTIFKNDNGTFTTAFETPQYLGITQLSVEDMNSDGRLDLLITHNIGNSSGNPTRFELLYQKGDGTFEDSHIKLWQEETTVYPIFKCVDMNSDGFMDLLITPSDKNFTDIYVSVDGMGFTRKTTVLPASYNSAFEDYNGDGYMDAAIPGNEGLNVYYGTADLNFKEPKVFPVSLSGLGWFSSVDVDLNGWPDLVAHGETNAGVILNTGNGTFKDSDIIFKQNWGSSLTITDFENDGDIDFVRLGNDGQHTGFNYLYRNQLADLNVMNLPPSAPTNVTAAYDSGKVVIKWSASTDDRTPSPLVTYNLHIVDTNGKIWLNAETNAAGTFRRRFASGNAGHSLSKTLNHLPVGTYTVRVQALDASLKLSVWSSNAQFVILPGPTALAVDRILLNKVALSWTSAAGTETNVIIERRAAGFDWAKIATLPAGTTSYTDAALAYNTLYLYRVFEAVGTSTTAVSNMAKWDTNMWVLQDSDLPNIYGYFDVSDFTGDGRMDLLVNGGMIYNGYGEDLTKATYENTAAGFVKRDLGTTYYNAAMSFVDFDGDFQPDIYQSGYEWATGYSAEVFHNNGDKTFTSATNSFTGKTNSIQSFFDFDMDNDLDILTTQPDVYPTIRNVYRNNGSGNYMNSGATACINCGEIVCVADFDRDGDEDVILGSNSAYELFLNTHNGLISTGVTFPAYEQGLTVADYNSDGYPDLILTSYSSYQDGVIMKNLGSQDDSVPKFEALTVNLSRGDPKTLSADFDHDGRTDIVVLSPSINILLNKGNDNFDSYVVPQMRVSLQTVKLIDFDNDGDLDIILGGYLLKDFTDYVRKTQIVVNQTIVATRGVFNSPPEVPTSLTTTQDEDGLHLNWSAPADDHTPSEGLTYDVVLYHNGKAITRGNLNPNTGQRLRLRPGTSIEQSLLNNLEVGTYSWQVQAVDGSFAGSSLSQTGTFTFLPPPPAINDTLIYRCGRTVVIGSQLSGLKWYRDQELTQPTATGPLTAEQTQTVYATQTINGHEGIARKVEITIHDKPSAPTVSATPIRICETPDVTTIWASGVNLKWYSNAELTGLLSSEQQLQIAATNATYYVTQTIDGCESNALATPVEVNEINSEIFSNGVDIVTKERGASFYTWYKNNNYLTTTQEPSIPFDGQIATYYVFIWKNGCAEQSQPFVSLPENILSLEEAPESIVSIYPNPASSTVTLKMRKTLKSMLILDSMGRQVYSLSDRNVMIETLDVAQWKKGVYSVVVDDGTGIYAKRLVVL